MPGTNPYVGFFPALSLARTLDLGDWLVGTPLADVPWRTDRLKELTQTLMASFSDLGFDNGALVWHRGRGSPRHRLGQDERGHAPGVAGRDGLGEKEPGMGAVPGTGPLDSHGQPYRSAGLCEREHVILPGDLVEVSCHEPAGVARQQRVDTDGVVAVQVTEDHRIVERHECLA